MRRVLDYCYRNSPFYRKKFDEAGVKPSDVRSIDDFLKKVPFSSKKEVLESQYSKPPFGDFLAVEARRIRRVYVSPGPLYEPYTEKDLVDTRRVHAEMLSSIGVRPGDVAQVTASYNMMPGAWYLHDGLEELGCTVIPAGPGESRMQVTIMRSFGTTVYLGAPSFLARIYDVCRELGVEPRKDLKLRIGFSSFEPLTPTLRRDLEEKFGVELFNAYGIGELGWFACECKQHDGMHVLGDHFLVEIIDPETLEPVGLGEEGEIVVTPLFREAMPLVRYRTGDLSSFAREPCPCGISWPKLTGIYGRVDMATKVKGVLIHAWQVQKVLAAHPELGRFQIVVDRPARIDVAKILIEVAPDKVGSEELKRRLYSELKDATHVDFDVELVVEGTIPKDAKTLEDRRKIWR